jgi:hypothetical protein
MVGAGLRPSSSRRPAVAAVALALVLLAACHPDPTGGARPPASAPAFSSTVTPVARADVPHSWREGCPVHWTSLSTVQVAYWGYDGARHTGRVVVHDGVVGHVRDAFRRMYDERFQIRRIHPVDAYGGSDDRSMAANNTSAFNCRRVAGATSWSEHADGRAIDINPVQNPYVKGSTVDPPAGRDWTDRSHTVPGMIAHGDGVWHAWRTNGWEWGGDWSSAKDYQHFSENGR